MKKILDTLNEQEKSIIKQKAFKKDEIIFNEGDECTTVSYIIKGAVSITTPTFIDNEYNIKTLFDGDSFGEFLVFSSLPYYLGSIKALKETTIAFIKKNDLLYLMKENSVFLEKFLERMSNDALSLQTRIKVLAQKTIREKILFYLKDEVEKTKSKTIYVTSKENLAKVINVPRPSLSRELISLKNEGYIKYGRHYITILI